MYLKSYSWPRGKKFLPIIPSTSEKCMGSIPLFYRRHKQNPENTRKKRLFRICIWQLFFKLSSRIENSRWLPVPSSQTGFWIVLKIDILNPKLNPIIPHHRSDNSFSIQVTGIIWNTCRKLRWILQCTCSSMYDFMSLPSLWGGNEIIVCWSQPCTSWW
jgi:hypothetical protein